MSKVRVFDIVYDTDGLKVELPRSIDFEIPKEDLPDIDSLAADLVSDKTGWCVFSCDVEVLKK